MTGRSALIYDSTHKWPQRLLLTARRIRNRFWPTYLLWHRSLDTELCFWRSVLATKGLGYEGFDHRFDPDAVLQEAAVIRGLDELPLQDSPFRVLDVGAGPMTNLGKIYKGKRLDIIAIDCLADQYKRLLEEFCIRPPVQTLQCESERLLDVVAPNSCDLVFSRNAIDHGYDPMLSILNMLAVVRKDCIVVLKHGLNEAEQSGYRGLHQWNFSTERERLILWKQGTRWDLTAELKGSAIVEWFMEKDWLVCMCRKI